VCVLAAATAATACNEDPVKTKRNTKINWTVTERERERETERDRERERERERELS
jgi:hypothetical protein